MAASLGSLVVSLGLDAAEYVTGLTRSEYQARKFAQQAAATFRQVTTVLGGVATSAVGAALAIERAADSIAVYKQLGEQIGATGQEVAGLQLASDLSGVALDTVAAASVRLTAALSKQDDESKGVGAALAAINIPIEEFKRLDPVSQLERVATQLDQFRDGSEKTAIAVALWGKAGADVLPFMNDLAEVGARNARLSEQQINEADRLTKQYAAMKSEAKSLQQLIAIDFVPAMSEIASAMRDAYRDGGLLLSVWVGLGGAAANLIGATERQQTNRRIREIDDQLATARRQIETGSLNPSGASKSFFSFLIPDVRLKDEAVAKLRETVGALEAERARLAASLAGPGGKDNRPKIDAEGLGGPPKETAKKVTEAQRYLETLTKQLQATQDLNAAATALAEIESGRLGALTAAQRDNILVTAQRIDQARLEVQQEREREELARASIEAQKRVISEAAAIVESTQTPFERLNQELTRLQWLLDNGYIGWETFARATLDAQERAEKTTAVVKAQATEWDEFAKNAARGIQQHLGDGLFDVMKGNFDNIGQSFADMVLRMVAEAQAAQIARYLLGDLVQGGEGKGVAGSLFSSLLQGVFGGGKAGGGPVDAGRMYRVAENRPEMLDVNGKQFLLMGRQRGHIDPNPRLGGRALTVNNHFVINGPASRQSQQQLAAAAGLSISRASRRLN